MYPWFRLMWVAACLIGQPRVDLFATTRIRLRVWPNDLDLNLHLNNARYFALADVARLHWFVKTGLVGVMRRQKAFPVIGDAIAKFRRDLKLFQSVEIHTKLLGWDDKWEFIEHRFVRDGRVIGVVAVRGVFNRTTGAVNPGALLKELSGDTTSPELPEWTQTFFRSSELMSVFLRTEESIDVDTKGR